MGWFSSQNDDEFKNLLIATYDTMGELINELNSMQQVTPVAEKYIAQMGNQVNRLYQMNSSGSFNSTSVIVDGQIVNGRDSLVGFVLFIREVERKTGKHFNLNINMFM